VDTVKVKNASARAVDESKPPARRAVCQLDVLPGGSGKVLTEAPEL
jgi:hypothetical protein